MKDFGFVSSNDRIFAEGMGGLFFSMVFFTLFFWSDPFPVFSVSCILGASKIGKSVGQIWACWMSDQYIHSIHLYMDPQAFI